jgi:hypothetical protein
MSLHRMLYVSFSVAGFDLQINTAILEEARELNLASGITGVLLCRDAVFMQVLEGPAVAVQATFARIRRDQRHQGVVVLAAYDAAQRIFPGWQMGFFHMSAVEPMVGGGLIRNGDTSLWHRLEAHAGGDPIATTLRGFVEANARELHFPTTASLAPLEAS